jgi:lysine biosynthesis protein LysW
VTATEYPDGTPFGNVWVKADAQRNRRKPLMTMKEALKVTLVDCPDCDEVIRLKGKPRLEQRVTCRSCGAELEVINLTPLELDWVYDYDDEDDYDDYDDD